MTTVTKPDWTKLKRTIHAVTALQRSTGDDHWACDLALYATYLYCIASAFRKHIHMRHWNIIHPRSFHVGLLLSPRQFNFKINTLDEQNQFISCARAFIVDHQEFLTRIDVKSVFRNLPLDFTREVEVVEETGTTIA